MSAEDAGPIEAAVRADVATLGDLEGVQPTLAQTAYALARVLDNTRGGMSAAAVAKELRATLQQLTESADDDDASRDLFARLSAPVGHAAKPGADHARPKGGRGGRAAGDSADAVAAARGRRRP